MASSSERLPSDPGHGHCLGCHQPDMAAMFYSIENGMLVDENFTDIVKLLKYHPSVKILPEMASNLVERYCLMPCLNNILNEQILHEESTTSSNITYMSGSGDHQHCGLAGTGRVWGGSWVIPITHITLQHYNITCTPHTGTGPVARSGGDTTRTRLILHKRG